MTYYKIIQNEHVIDAGFTFLKWNERRQRLNLCNEDQAQFVQSYDQKRVFKDTWLKPCSENNIHFENAQILIITQEEFEDIRALLDGDEEIPVLSDSPEETVQIVEPAKPVEETPLSISEMRRIIQEQQAQIATLAEKLTEVSKTVNK